MSRQVGFLYVLCAKCEIGGLVRLVPVMFAPKLPWDVLGDSRSSVSVCYSCYFASVLASDFDGVEL